MELPRSGSCRSPEGTDEDAEKSTVFSPEMERGERPAILALSAIAEWPFPFAENTALDQAIEISAAVKQRSETTEVGFYLCNSAS